MSPVTHINIVNKLITDHIDVLQNHNRLLDAINFKYRNISILNIVIL
jgi:hypothetical protein